MLMEDKNQCICCVSLLEKELPPDYMRLISSIPDSSIYRCRLCHTFWMCSVDNGWENLDFEALWDMADTA